MRATTSALVLLATLPLLLSAQARVRTISARDRRAEEEIRRLNEAEVQAFMTSDVGAMRRLWSDDFVVTNPLNQFVGKSEVLQLVQSGTLAFTSYVRDVEYVRVYGDVAIAAGKETVVWSGRMPSAGQTSPLRFTAVWRRQDGRWQEIARHANVVVPPPRQ